MPKIDCTVQVVVMWHRHCSTYHLITHHSTLWWRLTSVLKNFLTLHWHYVWHCDYVTCSCSAVCLHHVNLIVCWWWCHSSISCFSTLHFFLVSHLFTLSVLSSISSPSLSPLLYDTMQVLCRKAEFSQLSLAHVTINKIIYKKKKLKQTPVPT